MLRSALIVIAVLGLLGGPGGPSEAEELYGTLAKIDDSGRIVIGHRETSVPLSYRNADGDIEGYTIDLCMKVVEAIEAKLGRDDLRIDLVSVTPESRIPLVVDGMVDLECGSTTQTLARRNEVDFGLITFITGTRLLVRSGDGITEIEDLAGKRIAVATGSTNQIAIEEAAAELELNMEILAVADHQEGFDALEAGEADAYANDHIILHGLIAQAADPQGYEVTGRFLSYDPYAVMFRRDDSAFRLVVDETLAGLFRSGEIYPIYQRWFDPMGVPTNVLLEAAFAIQALPE